MHGESTASLHVVWHDVLEHNANAKLDMVEVDDDNALSHICASMAHMISQMETNFLGECRALVDIEVVSNFLGRQFPWSELVLGQTDRATSALA